MSLSPWSPLSFLLVGLIGGGPVLWLEMEDEEEDDEEDEEDEDSDSDWSLGSPLKAASPKGTIGNYCLCNTSNKNFQNGLKIH